MYKTNKEDQYTAVVKCKLLKLNANCSGLNPSYALFQEIDHLNDFVTIGVHVCLGVPKHIDKLLIVLLVHGNVLAQLRIEPKVRYANGAAPGAGAINDPSIRASGLVHKQITCKLEAVNQ